MTRSWLNQLEGPYIGFKEIWHLCMIFGEKLSLGIFFQFVVRQNKLVIYRHYRDFFEEHTILQYTAMEIQHSFLAQRNAEIEKMILMCVNADCCL